jgi:hypothetical protein
MASANVRPQREGPGKLSPVEMSGRGYLGTLQERGCKASILNGVRSTVAPC